MKKQLHNFMQLLFHTLSLSLISFLGGVFVKDPIFILTEQRQFDGEAVFVAAIQHAVTLWLTKELHK